MSNLRSTIYNLQFALFIILLLTGCAPKYEKFELSKANLKRSSFDDLEGFENDNIDTAFKTFAKGCSKARKSLKNICSKIKNYKDGKTFFMENFTPYKIYSQEHSDEGLITGYYEPLLYGSPVKRDKYKYPIYKVPNDMVIVDLSSVYPELKRYRLRGQLKGNILKPYPSRAELEKQNNLEPICFVDDKIDLFFLQIQGSGKVKFEDGTIINIGYAGQNGRKYYSIGRKLIEMGEIRREDISLHSIKKWLKENPHKADDILNLNESYVFFRESKRGATGSLGVELVANRNLAVDRSFIPLGYPVFINTLNPLTKKPINQLMVAADTGGAIKGEIRADFFWGNGKTAEDSAGNMKEKGKLYILIPNKL